MDELKMLSFDAKTYQDLIKGYTSDPYVTRVIENLNECIWTSDTSGIMVFLGRLKQWYEVNINKILDNSFVINFDSHKIAKEQIDNYFLSLSSTITVDAQEVVEKDEVLLEGRQEGYKIFVSHSIEDEPICTAFVHLLEMLGVPENNILYSSSEGFGIPADMDIFDYLKSSIAKEFDVYYMLSDNYYNSVYCLNEMGAAWINQNECSTFILPNFTRSIDGVIDSNKKA